jgi:hypothetical protein
MVLESLAKPSILPVFNFARSHALVDVNASQKGRKLTNDQRPLQ